MAIIMPSPKSDTSVIYQPQQQKLVQSSSSTFLLITTSGLSSGEHSPYPEAYGGGVLFPWRLHEMLEAAETKGFTSVVSWLPDRRSFKVHDKETFVSLVMGKYFEQTKYKSFQRQLNMWGFERHLSGVNKGGYTHSMFVRGKPSMCCRMSRHKKKSAPADASTTKNKTAVPARTTPRNKKRSTTKPTAMAVISPVSSKSIMKSKGVVTTHPGMTVPMLHTDSCGIVSGDESSVHSSSGVEDGTMFDFTSGNNTVVKQNNTMVIQTPREDDENHSIEPLDIVYDNLLLSEGFAGRQFFLVTADDSISSLDSCWL